MPETFIALLRGINVSGTNRLPMARLLDIARALGLADCRTYIQSGNLIFAATHEKMDGLETRLSQAIEAECGFRPPVMIRSLTEWDAVIASNPFPDEAATAAKTVHVFLMEREPASTAFAALKERDFGSDRWQAFGKTIYLHLPDGMGRSKLATSIERHLKVPMTARNWASMLAIRDLAQQNAKA